LTWTTIVVAIAPVEVAESKFSPEAKTCLAQGLMSRWYLGRTLRKKETGLPAKPEYKGPFRSKFPTFSWFNGLCTIQE
jgi:hypothetical protein